MRKLFIVTISFYLFWCNSYSQSFYGIDMSNPTIKQAVQNASKTNIPVCIQQNKSSLKSANVDCSYDDLDDISQNSQFIPAQNSPIITVRISLHIMQKSNGTGNFQNNSQDLAYLNSLVTGMNSRYSHLDTPLVGGVTGVLTVPDSRIQFELTGIYFHRDDAAWNDYGDIYSFNCYDNYAVNKDKDLNIFFCKYPSGNKLSGVGLGLWGENSNLEVNFDLYEDYLAFPPGTFGSNHIGGRPWIYIPHICHETGHCLGLYHTFQPDELSDTYSPDLGIWCDPSLDANCTNNIMSYSASRSSFSPSQIGKMRRLLGIGWRAKEQDNCNNTNSALNISSNAVWSLPRTVNSDINITNNSSLTIQCNVFLPSQRNIYVNNGSTLILDGGKVMNNCGNSIGIIANNGGYIVVESATLNNCSINVLNGGTLKIAGNTNVQNSSTINIQSGGYICIESTASLNLQNYDNVLNLYNGYSFGVNTAVIPNPGTCTSSVSSIIKTGNGSINSDIFIQNQILTGNQYIKGLNISAGSNVTTTVPSGSVTIQSGANITFDATGDILLDHGFEVQLGATFEAK